MHLYGHPADMTGLQAVADKHGLQLFEDAAQAHGASLHGTPVGAFGAFAMFSLYPTKNMTSGEGGMVSVATPEIERMLRLYRNQGMERQYENEVVGLQQPDDRHPRRDRPGAADQGRRLDRRRGSPTPRTSRRNLSGVTPPPVADGAVHVYHQYTVRVAEDRDGFAKALARGVRRRLRHVLPDPEPPAGAVQRRRRPARRPSGRRRECLSLPVHPSLSRGRPRARSSPRSTRWPWRAPEMANLRAGLIGLGMMGRHHARVLGALDGVDLVAVADPAGDPFHVRRRPPGRWTASRASSTPASTTAWSPCPPRSTRRSASRWPRPGCTRWSRSRLAQNTVSARRLADAFDSAGLVGAVGHIERYNPALQSAALAARQRRPRRGLPGRHPAAGSVPEPDRRRRRGQGPGHPRHRPDRVGDPAAVPLASSAHTAKRSGRPHEDLVAMIGQLEDGTVTNHLVNWLSPLKERVTTITGERGAFVADTLTGRPDLLRERRQRQHLGEPGRSSAASPRAT